MVPLGISSAAAVRVGQAVGRKDPRGVALSGWAAVLLGALFMGSACGSFPGGSSSYIAAIPP